LTPLSSVEIIYHKTDYRIVKALIRHFTKEDTKKVAKLGHNSETADYSPKPSAEGSSPSAPAIIFTKMPLI